MNKVYQFYESHSKKIAKKTQFDCSNDWRPDPLTKPTCSCPGTIFLQTPILAQMEFPETLKQVNEIPHFEKFWRSKIETRDNFFPKNAVGKNFSATSKGPEIELFLRLLLLRWRLRPFLTIVVSVDLITSLVFQIREKFSTTLMGLLRKPIRQKRKRKNGRKCHRERISLKRKIFTLWRRKKSRRKNISWASQKRIRSKNINVPERQTRTYNNVQYAKQIWKKCINT